MGGIGSGRRAGRPALEDLPRLALGSLFSSADTTTRTVTLSWPTGSHLVLLVTKEAVEPVDGWLPTVTVYWQPCALGGLRPLFGCPRCKSRCRFLYHHNRGLICRRCTGLIYRSQTHTRLEYLFYSIDRLQQRLVGTRHLPADLAPHDIPPKARRMRWRTYMGLTRRLSELQQEQSHAMVERLKALKG